MLTSVMDEHPLPGLEVVTLQIPAVLVNNSNGSLVQVKFAALGGCQLNSASALSLTNRRVTESMVQLMTLLDGIRAD